MFCVIFRDSSTTSQYGFLSRQKKCVFHLKNIFELLSVSIKKVDSTHWIYFQQGNPLSVVVHTFEL